ncbi:hypothetical protein R82526_04043 [Ralstonia mannitolilytica]|nr:hypothetical protein R82526_04043 [Ralstonia mannitolilytica]CAJ0741908.1 hypothetical protein R76696_03704 [Ralstonia mannitolilytica]CAJ0880139.1 hypothetical protein R76727_03261 [Ralstonia mannitolilytica]
MLAGKTPHHIKFEASHIPLPQQYQPEYFLVRKSKQEEA